eukprot:1280997-Rhodomonas_salina.1
MSHVAGPCQDSGSDTTAGADSEPTDMMLAHARSRRPVVARASSLSLRALRPSLSNRARLRSGNAHPQARQPPRSEPSRVLAPDRRCRGSLGSGRAVLPQLEAARAVRSCGREPEAL